MLGLEWTTDREEQLTKLWADGISATKIAAILGRISRNAIIGKAHRLGLAKRHNTPARLKKKPVAGARARPPYNRPAAPPLAPAPPGASGGFAKPRVGSWGPSAADSPGLSERLMGEAPDGTGVQVRDLTENNCHWPKGDPKEAGFEFCGAPAIEGKPYCARHCALAYQPPYCRYRADKALAT